jgi:hypothetical protein
MTQKASAANEVARLLWARATDGSDSPEEVVAAAERTCIQLRAGLGRWIGAMGYRALLDRALILARAEHPALGSLSGYGGDEAMITAAVRTHGAAEVAAGMVALVSRLVELLGRIIGEEMALRLVEQTGTPSGGERERVRVSEREGPRGVVITESRGARNADVD